MAECMGNMLHITDRYIDKHESLGAQPPGGCRMSAVWLPSGDSLGED